MDRDFAIESVEKGIEERAGVEEHVAKREI